MTVRFAVRRACLVALMGPLIVMAACGGDPDLASTEPWPLTLNDSSVLGYVAVQPSGEQLAQFATETFGWTPAGLAADRPVVLVHFDARTYGGGLGVLIPVSDEGAFRASLDSAPSLESLGQGRYRLQLPSDSPLVMLMAMAARMGGTSPISALHAMADGNAMTFSLHVDVRGQHAMVAPSLEALGVCGRVLRATGGFVDSPEQSVVLSVDLDRIRVSHAERFRSAEEQLRNLISGVQRGGTLMGLMAMAASQESAEPPLPVNWELVWAVKEMLAVSDMSALQFRTSFRDPGSDPVQTDAEVSAQGFDPGGMVLDWLNGLSLRLAFSDDSRLGDVLDTLSSGAAVADAEFTLRVDPKRFPRAFAEWCRPIAEVVKGEGAPCDRYLDELVELLSNWGGLLALRIADDGQPMILLGMSSDVALESEALAHWLEPLLATARIESIGDSVRSEPLPDGRRVFMNAQGEPTLTVGRTGVVLWIAPGASSPPDIRGVSAVEAALAADESWGPPGLSFSTHDAHATLSVQDRELELDLRVEERER